MSERSAVLHPERLLVGTRGWDHDRWTGGYYPEELPKAWRLAYYCNDFRSVWVPADHWREAPAAVLGFLAEEIDEGFSLVLELPAEGLGAAGLSAAALRTLLEPLGRSLHALSWRPAVEVAEPELASVAGLAREWPLVLDFGAGHPLSEALKELRSEVGASRLWRPQETDEPEDTGKFLLASLADPGLPRLRRKLEQIDRWMGAERGGGLFLEATTRAPELAKQCRILTELLEI